MRISILIFFVFCAACAASTANVSTGSEVYPDTELSQNDSAHKEKQKLDSAADHGEGHGDDEPRPFDVTRRAMFDVEKALASAKMSGKNVILVLGGNWCHDSRAFAKNLQAPEFESLLEEAYELVYVDVGMRDRNLNVPKRFGVNDLFGTPTVLILSSNGELLNADTVHDWKTAATISLEETKNYFLEYTPRP